MKSKFARLCFYYDIPGKEQAIHSLDFLDGIKVRMNPSGEDDSLEDRLAKCIDKYEAKSTSVCECCGAENAEICNEKPVFNWVMALCPSCKEERIRRYNANKVK